MLACPNRSLRSPSPAGSTGSDVDQLRSYFDRITKGCDVFRILLVGKAGSGKSTLVSEVFDFELDRANVQDFTVGEHDINHEITSPNNKSLSLHDSKGIESGSAENLKIITDFIADRKGRPFSEQLHAIWYCIEIPIAGQRPFEGGDIALFNSLLKTGNKVPVIIVFTKLDRLQYREQKRLKKVYVDRGMDPKSAQTKAKADSVAAAQKEYKTSCVEILESSFVPAAWTLFCPVSNKQHDSITKLIELTKSTLQQSESLNILWASAQMADIDLKVEMSLEAGKNMYWPGLGAALIPLKGVRRITLLTILSRVHSDVVRIWNFKDPEDILIGANMRMMIRKLFIEPIVAPSLEGIPGPDAEGTKIIESVAQDLMYPGVIAPAVADASKILDEMSVATPATARVLMAYVADLTLGMEGLYWLVRPRENKAITRQDVVHAFTTYRASSQRGHVHMLIRDYIGDENIMRSFSRDKALKKVADIISKRRFNPQEVFNDLQ